MKIQPDTTFEQALWSTGVTLIAGVDEAGRGAWAGPVSAGAVILPQRPDLAQCLSGVRDSKQMTALQRACWAEKIRFLACAWGVGFSSAEEIDALGIVPATRLAMQRAIGQLASTGPPKTFATSSSLGRRAVDPSTANNRNPSQRRNAKCSAKPLSA